MKNEKVQDESGRVVRREVEQKRKSKKYTKTPKMSKREKRKMEFNINITNEFIDKEKGELVRRGAAFFTKDQARAENIIKAGLGRLRKITTSGTVKTGKKVIVFHDRFAKIGGIETSILNLARYCRNTNTTFAFQAIDFQDAVQIAQTCDVMVLTGKAASEHQRFDVLIVEGYDGYAKIKGLFIAGKIYQICHADWASLKKVSPTFKNYQLKIDPDITKILAVSPTAKRGLERAFEKPIRSIVVPNCPSTGVPNPLTFLTLSRLTSEKGGERIIKMIDVLEKNDKDYLWIVASTMDDGKVARYLKNNPKVICIEPDQNRKALLRRVDYLVQLSDSESYSYSVREALSVGTPVIGTRIPEFERLIDEGKNGYLLDLDLANLDIEKISKIPKPEPRLEKASPLIDKMLQGEL